ncbi:helix-turn-helix transcriptional regulator [Bacillus sp. DNRA2]|uniref:helix-turn-helix domain-containing protein n=1 Tax=Bacillus sp. DNRA2 TaxID=2723053 RepID=UPI00145E3C6D|nr:helix-turn-helix transcriptional regulator [Bacillus sp. DNRA2]NMD70868.1 helix-turn-helix transcriptional regulator [Bacillus sp. DNRA2]
MIGNIINELRKKRGLSLSELADRARISKSYLSNIERNLNQNPSIQVMQKIAFVLDVDLNTLLIKDHRDQDEDNNEKEWETFVNEIKDLEREQIKEFKTIVDYIKWKNNVK